MNLPTELAWLAKEPGPKMLVEALKHYGTLEDTTNKSNPNIMRWAEEVGVRGWYASDAVPWCGLFMGVCALRAGYPHNSKLLAARSWLDWGEGIPKGREMLADVGVWSRPGGHHTAFIIARSKTAFFIYGGNQKNAVGFTWISHDDFLGARRPFYKIGEPENVRRIIMDRTGVISDVGE